MKPSLGRSKKIDAFAQPPLGAVVDFVSKARKLRSHCNELPDNWKRIGNEIAKVLNKLAAVNVKPGRKS